MRVCDANKITNMNILVNIIDVIDHCFSKCFSNQVVIGNVKKLE